MTRSDMKQLEGRQGSMRVEQTLFIPIQTIAVRQVFNRIDVLVSPISGKGRQWVSLDRVDLNEKEPIA